MTTAGDSDDDFDPAAGLLPAGLRDVLPPRAAFEAQATERLLSHFAAWGYQRVKPPLIEFEQTLLAGSGEKLAAQMFRLMDPVSQHMMGLRTDITLQVARIAATRLKMAARPLRLSYAGQVLRVRGSQLRPERQFAQAGVELIGAASLAADVEVVRLAAESLIALGVPTLSFDLTHPRLALAVCAGAGLSDQATAKARLALDRKDAAALRLAAGKAAPVLEALLAAAGPAEKTMTTLRALKLPAEAQAMVDELDHLVGEVRAAAPDLPVTVDPGEFRGFEYHSGISFSIFARGVRGELGSGGRYRTSTAESATGFTLYLDSIMRALPAAEAGPSLYLPVGTPRDEARRLRADGWVAVQGLDRAPDDATEALRLGCTHLWQNGRIEKLD